MNNPPPSITIDEYKKFITEFLEADGHDETWKASLEKRKVEAETLQAIVPILPMGYILKFTDHQKLIWLPQPIYSMMMNYPPQARSIIAHYLLQTHNWQMIINVPEDAIEMYERFGMSEEQIEPIIEKIKEGGSLTSQLTNLAIGTGVGAVICLIIAAVMKKEQPQTAE